MSLSSGGITQEIWNQDWWKKLMNVKVNTFLANLGLSKKNHATKYWNNSLTYTYFIDFCWANFNLSEKKRKEKNTWGCRVYTSVLILKWFIIHWSRGKKCIDNDFSCLFFTTQLTVVLEKTLESPLDSKGVKPVNPTGNQPWIVTGRTDAEAPVLWPPNVKS